MLDVDLNLVIEADLHLLTVIIIQLGTAPAQYDSVVFIIFGSGFDVAWFSSVFRAPVYTLCLKINCTLFVFCNNLVECQPISIMFGTVTPE